jgi:hypothetical protein
MLRVNPSVDVTGEGGESTGNKPAENVALFKYL